MYFSDLDPSLLLSNDYIDDNDCWVVVEAYKKMNGVAHPSIRSYNNVINTDIPNLIMNQKPIILREDHRQSSVQKLISKITGTESEDVEVRHIIDLVDCFIDMPRNTDMETPLTPIEAKILGLSYSGNIYVDFSVERIERDVHSNKINIESFHTRQYIGSIPIMVGSDLCWTTRADLIDNEPTRERACPYEEGGVFIIKGKEKIINSQENIKSKKILCHIVEDNKRCRKILGEIRSCKEEIRHIVAPIKHFELYMNVEYSATGDPILLPKTQMFYFQSSGMDNSKVSKLSIVVLLTALGMENRFEIVRHVIKDCRPDLESMDILDADSTILYMLLHMIHESRNINTKKDALIMIGKCVAKRNFYYNNNDGDRCQTRREHEEIESVRDRFNYHQCIVSCELSCEKEIEWIDTAEKFIARELFPHISYRWTRESEEFSLEKAIFICTIIRKVMFTYIGTIEPDDRDYGGNKRYEGNGDLFMKLFSPQLKRMKKDMVKSLNEKISQSNGLDIAKSIKPKTIKQKTHSPIATGTWPSHNIQKQTGKAKVGITNDLNRTTRVATLSHHHRITTSSAEKNTKMTKNRQVHPSSYQRQCPSETPEGKRCGIVNNFAFAGMISEGSDPEEIIDLLQILSKNIKFDEYDRSLYVLPLQEYLRDRQQMTNVHNNNDNTLLIFDEDPIRWATLFLNGRIYGYCKCPIAVVEYVRRIRRCGKIHHEVSVHQVAHEYAGFTEVHISTECGRLVHPAFTMEAIDQNETLLFTQFVERMKNQQCTSLFDNEDYLTMNHLRIRKKHIYRLLNQSVTGYSYMNLIRDGLVEILDCDEEGSYSLCVVRPSEINHPNPLAMRHYSHCMLQPSMILGVCGLTNPLAEHNPGPRLTYQISMGKQPNSIPSLNINHLYETQTCLLHYPQVPLITTHVSRMMHCDDLPAGQNVVVLVMNKGYNQEDAVVINQSSIDRGIFRSYTLRSYRSEEKIEYNGHPERFQMVQNGNQSGSYDFLDNDGIVSPGSKLKSGDVIIGKMSKIIEKQERNKPASSSSTKSKRKMLDGNKKYVSSTPITKVCDLGTDETFSSWTKELDKKKNKFQHLENRDTKDKSISLQKNGVNIVIDSVLMTNTNNTNKGLKTSSSARQTTVRTRILRIPEIGDKMSSRHGQKGTIGMIYKQHEMPYTMDGIRPDLIISPFSQTSRMTFGDLSEKLLSKSAALRGDRIDATVFNNLSKVESYKPYNHLHTSDNDMEIDVDPEKFREVIEENGEDESGFEEIQQNLFDLGYQKYGEEQLYCGKTGEMYLGTMFIGLTQYQRLKHLSRDKISARETGRRHPITRQPVEGRQRNGGLRFGEMERDTLVAHGASANMREVQERSDMITVLICENCGSFTHRNFEIDEENFCVKNYTTNACFLCQNKTTAMKKIEIPYATVLYSEEMKCAGVDMKFKVE
jgi:DNA-directed RNA polymerase II subunit RPB2